LPSRSLGRRESKRGRYPTENACRTRMVLSSHWSGIALREWGPWLGSAGGGKAPGRLQRRVKKGVTVQGSKVRASTRCTGGRLSVIGERWKRQTHRGGGLGVSWVPGGEESHYLHGFDALEGKGGERSTTKHAIIGWCEQRMITWRAWPA